MVLDFDSEKFVDFLVDEGCVKFGKFTLSSGRVSNYYVNFRNLLHNLESTREMVDHAYSFIEENLISQDLKPNTLYGVPEGATPWGLLLTDRIDYLPTEEVDPLMGRGSPKPHGDPKDRNFIGDTEGEVVVVDDVATTGSSLIEELGKLEDSGFKVDNVLVFLDRLEKSNGKLVAEKMEERGYNYFSMTDAKGLLRKAKAYTEEDLDEEVKDGIREYLEEHSDFDLDV